MKITKFTDNDVVFIYTFSDISIPTTKHMSWVDDLTNYIKLTGERMYSLNIESSKFNENDFKEEDNIRDIWSNFLRTNNPYAWNLYKLDMSREFDILVKNLFDTHENPPTHIEYDMSDKYLTCLRKKFIRVYESFTISGETSIYLSPTRSHPINCSLIRIECTTSESCANFKDKLTIFIITPTYEEEQRKTRDEAQSSRKSTVVRINHLGQHFNHQHFNQHQV